MNRRQLLTSIVTLTGIATILPTIVRAERKRGGDTAATGPVLVDTKDAQAKAVNYGASHKEITDKALQTERSGVKWVDQKCSGCAFYDKTKEVSVGGVKAAPCSMPFAAGKVVAQNGWCSSWAKKA
jgi:High potential iron-sulfur protein